KLRTSIRSAGGRFHGSLAADHPQIARADRTRPARQHRDHAHLPKRVLAGAGRWRLSAERADVLWRVSWVRLSSQSEGVWAPLRSLLSAFGMGSCSVRWEL